MNGDRVSLPPGDDSLARFADQHRKRNDELERSVGHIALPVGVLRATAVDVTDEQRLVVIHEMHAECRSSGGSTVLAFQRFEDKVRARLAAAPKAAE